MQIFSLAYVYDYPCAVIKSVHPRGVGKQRPLVSNIHIYYICFLQKDITMSDTKLVNNSQVKHALKINGIVGDIVARLAMKVTGLNKMNDIYSNISRYKGVEFAQKLIEYQNVECPDFVNVSPKNFLRTKERYVDGVS